MSYFKCRYDFWRFFCPFLNCKFSHRIDFILINIIISDVLCTLLTIKKQHKNIFSSNFSFCFRPEWFASNQRWIFLFKHFFWIHKNEKKENFVWFDIAYKQIRKQIKKMKMCINILMFYNKITWQNVLQIN